MKENTIYTILIIVCILSILAVTILIFTTKNGESFTEIYFENHQNLPKKIDLNQNYGFYFTIHNLENQPFTYSYQINLDLDGKTQILKQNQIILNHNQKQPIYHQLQINQPFKQEKIVISLLNKQQSIHFWLK